MFEQATAIVTGLRELVGDLEPRCLRGEDAARLLVLFAEAERLAGVGKALMARRVQETSLHRRAGHRSAADYVAAKTGTSAGAAGRELETARRLERLPAASQAWRGGELSPAQAGEIASAATADPSAEAELVAVAGSRPLGDLAQRCRAVRAAAADEAARHAALPRSRYLRHLPLGPLHHPRGGSGHSGRVGALPGPGLRRCPGGGSARAVRGLRR